MMPIVFINCQSAPFIDDIITGRKVYETRSRDTLRDLVGRFVLLAETGKGKPVVRCRAKITRSFRVILPDAWERFRSATCVPAWSRYDWKPDTCAKWMYELQYVRPVPAPFTPPEGVRHGRVWMEYNGEV